MSFGIDSQFDVQFNQARAHYQEPCPLDEAFQKQKVVAISELEKEPNLPDWFVKVMNKFGFRSLVAVPLLGQTKPVGILCVYYHDVCLFDQGTLDRLMGIGRMVGVATEKSLAAGKAESHDARERVVDEYLYWLTSKSYVKLQVYSLLTKTLVKGLDPVSIICGPIRVQNDSLTLTVVDGAEVPSALISHRLHLPPLFQKKLITGKWAQDPVNFQTKDFGDLGSLLKGRVASLLCLPIVWQSKLQGAVLVWRQSEPIFDKDDEILLSRLTQITSLALNAV